MPHYVVTLELRRGAKQHYDDLAAATAELDCCRPFEAVLLVCSSWTAEQLQAYLRPHVDPMDNLTVDLLAEGHAWTGRITMKRPASGWRSTLGRHRDYRPDRAKPNRTPQ